MKLALGTVQFGLPYGIHNRHGIPSDEALKQLLEYASASGMQVLDTAYAYGNAEERLGKWSTADWKTVSKFPKPEKGYTLRDYFNLSSQRLQRTQLYAYMAHNANILLSLPALWEELTQLKAEGKLEKIGYSLYHPNELEQLLELGMIPDIVQVPYSLLDRKFEPWFERLRSFQCEIHTRSAFLQGLYFMPLDSLPEKLQPLKGALEALHALAADSALSMEALALQFVVANPLVDQVVIGTETPDQLRANLTAVNGQLADATVQQIRTIESAYPELLNPATWHA